jgi:hypothetical protein
MCYRIVLLLGASLTTLLNAPSFTRANDAVLLLDSFEDLQNSVGGYRNGFAKSPSTSVCRRVSHENAPGHCFRIRARRSDAGCLGYECVAEACNVGLDDGHHHPELARILTSPGSLPFGTDRQPVDAASVSSHKEDSRRRTSEFLVG